MALSFNPEILKSLFTRHKVFVSYHHVNDQFYRDAFERMFAQHYQIFISKSVQIGDIDPTLKVDTIRQKIRDEYLRDTTVTVVLIGSETWKRRHIDWEISSSIRQTPLNSRSGLIGIILPYHPNYYTPYYEPGLVPPRLFYNQKCGYSHIYKWSNNPLWVVQWIQAAFDRRNIIVPDNAYPHFAYNRFGIRWC